MGYTHIGHIFPSNAPPTAEHLKHKENKNYETVVVGDDLGSENYV